MTKSVKRILSLSIFILLSFLSGCIDIDFDPYIDTPLEEYYYGAEGLTGNELKVFLTELLAEDVKGNLC